MSCLSFASTAVEIKRDKDKAFILWESRSNLSFLEKKKQSSFCLEYVMIYLTTMPFLFLSFQESKKNSYPQYDRTDRDSAFNSQSMIMLVILFGGGSLVK